MPFLEKTRLRHSERQSRWCIGHFVRVACIATLSLWNLGEVRGQEETAPVPPASTSGEVKVSEGGTVDLHVADLPLSTVLELLSIESRRNIVASPKVKGTVTANLYGVTLEEALDAILHANGAGYRTSGKFIHVYTQAELDQMAAAEAQQPVTRVFRLNYVSAADAETYISPLLGDGENLSVSPPASSGMGSDRNQSGGNMNAHHDFIIVNAAPETLRKVEHVLSEIDVRPRQVLVEATILRAELSDENSLGIDFTVVGSVDLEMLGASSTGIQNLTLGQLPDDQFNDANANATTDFAGNVPDGGLSLGIIKDHVWVFIRALEQVTDTTVIANPKILALNRQKGQVIVGRRDGYLTTTVTETQAVQTVEFLETGTQLIFRPFIGDDGWVRMELHPEDSVGFVNAQGLPSEQTTEVTTNVMVRDNETILIGGLFREVTTAARSQIPLLGTLPGVGALFRSRNDQTNREEVIILLTIHVVKDQEALAAESEKIVEDMERIRVGARKGLMWHGRVRLAHAHYTKALESDRKGNERMALWHADMALRNNPRLLPAIELRERLTRKRFQEEDVSIGRFFMERLMRSDAGANHSLLGSANSPPDPSDRDSTNAVPGTAAPQ